MHVFYDEYIYNQIIAIKLIDTISDNFYDKSVRTKTCFKLKTRLYSDELDNLIMEEKLIPNYFKVYFNQLLNQLKVEEDNDINYYYTAEPKIGKTQRKEINNKSNKK